MNLFFLSFGSATDFLRPLSAQTVYIIKIMSRFMCGKHYQTAFWFVKETLDKYLKNYIADFWCIHSIHSEDMIKKLIEGAVSFRQKDFETHEQLFSDLGREQKPHTLF